MVKRVHLAARVYPDGVHDITNKHTTVASIDITTCHDLGDTLMLNSYVPDAILL